MQNFIPQFNPFAQYGYQPNISQNQFLQPQSLTKVSGLEGAKAYQMPPNSSAALFHESEDLLYVKTTDGAGFPTIRVFRFEPYDEKPPETVRYVTVDEFEKFKEEMNAKQSVQ